MAEVDMEAIERVVKVAVSSALKRLNPLEILCQCLKRKAKGTYM